jgi:threonyl-tRNA synthetase
MKELAQRDGQFQRFEISWDEAVEYFKKEGDPYKLEILEG